MSYRLLQGDALDVLETLEPQSVHCVVTSPPYWGLRDYGTDEQLGLEATPEEYVRAMVTVFDRVWRVLRDDGTLWLNLGDSYAVNGGARTYESTDGATGRGDAPGGNRTAPCGYKPKDLIGMPWRVALELQAYGWYLRSDIIWHKPNPMPESVKDRPTSAHEHLFLLSKAARYYYDAEAVRERKAATTVTDSRGNGNGHRRERGYPGAASNGGTTLGGSEGGRNMRNVWTIPTQAFAEAHFATYPTALVKPCVLAGTSERGVCPACGKPWERVKEKPIAPDTLRNRGNGSKMDFHRMQIGNGQKLQDWYNENPSRTAGWRPTCECGAGDPVPATVLDPFCGSGTTGLVALTYGRDFIGIDLSPEYLAMAERRIAPAAAQTVLEVAE